MGGEGKEDDRVAEERGLQDCTFVVTFEKQGREGQGTTIEKKQDSN